MWLVISRWDCREYEHLLASTPFCAVRKVGLWVRLLLASWFWNSLYKSHRWQRSPPDAAEVSAACLDSRRGDGGRRRDYRANHSEEWVLCKPVENSPLMLPICQCLNANSQIYPFILKHDQFEISFFLPRSHDCKDQVKIWFLQAFSSDLKQYLSFGLYLYAVVTFLSSRGHYNASVSSRSTVFRSHHQIEYSHVRSSALNLPFS